MRRTTPREKEIPPDDTDPRVSIILKCDVDGSLEALMEVLESYQSDHVKLVLVSSGVGGVTPTDVNLAHAFKGSIYTFNVATERPTHELAETLGVRIVSTNIIYRLVEQLKEEITAQLPPLPKEVIVGRAEVQEEFLINEGKKRIPVAGCRCVKGQLKKSDKFRLRRGVEEELVFEGSVSSMRHHKSEADTIATDRECGIRLQDSSIRFQKGDVLECFRIELQPQKCDWHPPGF